jgi:hypothetical protein
MPRFTIKELLSATALIAVGLGCSGYVLNFKDARAISSLQISVLISLYFFGWMLAGYGIGLLLRRPKLGWALGLVSGIALVSVWEFHPNSVLWWLHVNGI